MSGLLENLHGDDRLMATQCETLLEALKRGERLTVLDALNRFGVMALSQRIGSLKREGHPIESQMIRVPSGKRVACYWMRET